MDLKLTVFRKLGGFHHKGYNNNHVVKVSGRGLKSNVDTVVNGVLKSDVLLIHAPTLTSSLVLQPCQ